MSRYCLVAILTFLAAALGLRSDATELGAMKTVGVKIAITSDTHLGDVVSETNKAQLDTLLAFVARQHPMKFIITGDLTVHGGWNPKDTARVRLREWQEQNGIEVLTTLGNHESDYYGSSDSIPSGTNPYSTMLGHYPRTHDRMWYSVDIGHVTFLAMNDIVDTTGYLDPQYWQMYPDGNPPGKSLPYWRAHGYPNGRNITNPDYTGFGDTTSTQATWALAECAAKSGRWIMAGVHRSIYPAYRDVQSYSRPIYKAPRSKLIAKMIREGFLRILVEGDVHICSIVGPIYKNSANTAGVYALTHKSNDYVTRTFTDSSSFHGIPKASILYPTVFDEHPAENHDHAGFVSIMTFNGDRVYEELYRYANDYTTPTRVFTAAWTRR